ncbi:hypothetical protein [Changpingibacter yushuensis]|uniref:hypothetical protein n=1 Tax=Changpingibacter yushuensis TaxID=2758440 RepID=UPI0015F70784|nr:hypothetical protein [Changpingibacter yushuensis]
MSHFLDVFSSLGYPCVAFICDEPTDAPCRTRPLSGHLDEWDESEPMDGGGHPCWAEEWVNDIGIEDALRLPRMEEPLARIPISITYDGCVDARPEGGPQVGESSILRGYVGAARRLHTHVHTYTSRRTGRTITTCAACGESVPCSTLRALGVSSPMRPRIHDGLDLGAIGERYTAALDAKPSKGAWSEAGISTLCDSVADVKALLDEVERLTGLSS